MKVKIDVDGDGKDDIKVEVPRSFGGVFVRVVAGLAAACFGSSVLL